jgi:alkanesulfonate monooxygenase SsuD/methylene tetrahydromethanopterin reductase-like flavin-dependent oxidoreductase (luciferase family)
LRLGGWTDSVTTSFSDLYSNYYDSSSLNVPVSLATPDPIATIAAAALATTTSDLKISSITLYNYNYYSNILAKNSSNCVRLQLT